MSAATIVGLDFETKSRRDLKKVGLDNYLACPDFAATVACLNSDSFERRYDLLEPMNRQRFKEDFLDLNRSVNVLLCAHNARFERLVLEKMGLPIGYWKILDSAVLARMVGASSSLRNSSRQLTGDAKLDSGAALIRLFCMPDAEGNFLVDRRDQWDAETRAKWELFIDYCQQDAKACRVLAEYCLSVLPPELVGKELGYAKLTDDMNSRGWPVDVDLVRLFQAQVESNQKQTVDDFVQQTGAVDLNLRSTPQLVAWARERGLKATSFDEAHVAKMLTAVRNKLLAGNLSKAKLQDYEDLERLLITKQTIGGASLKKLPVILDRTGSDGRLREQYLHVGAGQSYRTTGVGVQMQNLPRLPAGVTEIPQPAPAICWGNSEISDNLRQCFTSSDLNGVLIVADFSSVESRGLAFLAGEKWKLQAYEERKDLYMVLASKIYGVPYDLITKTQRQTGKVGELSCGYGAGAEAVQSFAEGMGVVLSLDETSALVTDWRTANPETTRFWDDLNDALHQTLASGGCGSVRRPEGVHVLFGRCATPASLLAQHPRVQSIAMELFIDGHLVLHRVFHGCYFRGNDVCFYKPSDNVGGNLWSATFRNPKTKQQQFHKLWGGKIAGVLVQSFCRELFFRAMERCDLAMQDNLQMVGQFHDELVFDWVPGLLTREEARNIIGDQMLLDPLVPEFPLMIEINEAYRYIK